MPLETQAKIREIIARSHNVKSFRLELEKKGDFKAGQFLSVTLNNNPELRRYLSISSSPTEGSYLEFTKKLTGSNFSRALDALRPGDSLTLRYPFGSFVLDDRPGKIAFLSGGIGITPIRSICRYVVDTKQGIDIVLVYSNRSIRDIVFKEDFDAMQKVYPGLKVAHVLCESQPGFKCTVGLINSTVLRNEVPDYAQRKFYLCGPPQMVEEMKKILREDLCLPDKQMVSENFQGY